MTEEGLKFNDCRTEAPLSETPSTKLQAPENSQISNTKA
jgi:hypothetical protein